MYVYPTSSSQARYQQKVNFKWSKASLNSDFSFIKTSYNNKVEESSLPDYLPVAVEER